MKKLKKHGVMATYPKRYKSLLEMLPTILPQLDRLYIYCNSYDNNSMSNLSEEVSKLNTGSCTIRLIDASFAEGDVKDMGKFWMIHAVRGYVFLLDDDLLYPQNYTKQHIENIDRTMAISAVHARWITKLPLSSYFGDTNSINYKRKMDAPKTPTAHIAGTGTSAYCTKHFKPRECSGAMMRAFAGMADIYFAMEAKKQGCPIKVVSRPENWLKDTKSCAGTVSLWAVHRHDTKKHCKVLNSETWELEAV